MDSYQEELIRDVDERKETVSVDSVVDGVSLCLPKNVSNEGMDLSVYDDLVTTKGVRAFDLP